MEKTQSKLTLKLKEQIEEKEYDNKNRYRDWVFTLNNYQEEDIKRIQDIPSKYQVFGKEIAPTTGTKHLQGYIYFIDKVSKRQVINQFKKVNISNEVYVAPRYRKSTPEKASAYCKKNKQPQDIYENGQIPVNDIDQKGNQGQWIELKEQIQQGKQWTKIIEDNPALVGRYSKGVKVLYDVLRPKPVFDLTQEYEQLRPFQQEVLEYVKQVPDKRKILWIVDKTGASGKSELADHLMDNNGFIAMNNGKTADMAYVWNGEHIIMDLSRTQEEHLNYEAMEQLKNGRIMSSKYESCIKRYNRPHFIVVANYEPNIKSMSLDRWDIRYINEQYELVGKISIEKSKEGDTMPKFSVKDEIIEEVESPEQIIYSETDTPEQIIQTQTQEIKQLQGKILRLQHKINQTSINKKGAKATKERSDKNTQRFSLLNQDRESLRALGGGSPVRVLPTEVDVYGYDLKTRSII